MSVEIPPSRAARIDPLSLLWRLLAAPQTLMVLFGLLAVCLALGALIPQIPLQAVQDPDAWLAVQPGMLGQTNNLIGALGLFDIYHAFWFRLLLTLIGLALLVWCIEACEVAWRANGQGHWTSMALARWGRYPPMIRVQVPSSIEDVLDRTHDLLARQRLNWVDLPELPVSSIAIGCRLLLLWAWPAFYAALFSGLVGLVILGGWGWRNPDWQARPGETQAVGHGTSYQVRFEASAAEAGAAGLACALRSQIAWLEGETEVRRDSVGSGWPSTLGGITVRQVGCIPAVRLSGQDDTGRPLSFQVAGEEPTLKGQVEVTFPATDVQVLYLPGQDLILVLTILPAQAGGRSTLDLALVRDGNTERQPLATLQESSPVAVDGLQLQVDLSYGPVLRIDHRPGVALVLGALILAAVALATIWLAPARLAWCVIEPATDDSTWVQLMGLPHVRGSQWLAQLAQDLHRVLANDD
jgi:hypothetical protein